ncbi:MAG TPA: hypothetical protein VNL94_07255 [Candidatus Binatia bacterium]|nr:hypothetical protein [Candidatus Binatia bacterium]
MARLLGLLLLGLVAAACADLISAPGGSDRPVGSGHPQPLDRIHQQAHDALERWADAVRENGGAAIEFTGDLTSQIGAWEPDVASNNEPALLAGALVAPEGLPTERPGKREVKWVDGKRVETQVLSAAAALEALIEDADAACRGCLPIVITEANLATGLAETSTGPAELPMWVFSVEGSAVRITRVAVDKGVTVDPPPWNAADPPVGISIAAAFGTPKSRTITAQFLGARDGGDKPCGASYTAEAVESDLAIVVIVTAIPGPTGDGGCPPDGRTREVEVRLEAPLGQRAVLEVRQGLPVPVLATAP